MERRKFVKQTVSLLLLGVPLAGMTASCASGVEPAPPLPNNDPKDCLANGTNASIGTNHGHSLTVSKADVQSGVEKSYSIEGSASHDHILVISADNFTSLKNNTSIQVTSDSGGGHSHSVTVSCA